MRKAGSSRPLLTVFLLFSVFINPLAKCAFGAERDGADHLVVSSKGLSEDITGLRAHEPSLCYDGYTLFSHFTLDSGATRIYRIYLIDMQGKVVHQWITQDAVVFARLLPDGDIIYISGTQGIKRIDPESREVWSYPGYIDHAFNITHSGDLLIVRKDHDDNTGHDPVTGPPRIEVVTHDRNIIWRWRGEEHQEELEDLLGLKISTSDGWSDNNACEELPDTDVGRKDRRFRKGNIIFSYRKWSVIGIIDRDSGEIVWAWGHGAIDDQHTPTMLENGNILIFDNGSGRAWSRVIELDPLSEKIVWEYRSAPEDGFYSRLWSNAQRLPNGNTLICEGQKERMFEITPSGRIVWDFVSTLGKTTGCYGIYRAYRYSPDHVGPLFRRARKH